MALIVGLAATACAASAFPALITMAEMASRSAAAANDHLLAAARWLSLTGPDALAGVCLLLPVTAFLSDDNKADRIAACAILFGWAGLGVAVGGLASPAEAAACAAAPVFAQACAQWPEALVLAGFVALTDLIFLVLVMAVSDPLVAFARRAFAR